MLVSNTKFCPKPCINDTDTMIYSRDHMTTDILCPVNMCGVGGGVAHILHEVFCVNPMIKFFETSEIMEKANMHTYSIVCTPYTQTAYTMSRSLMSLLTNAHGNNIQRCPKQQIKVQNASSPKRTILKRGQYPHECDGAFKSCC